MSNPDRFITQADLVPRDRIKELQGRKLRRIMLALLRCATTPATRRLTTNEVARALLLGYASLTQPTTV